jgi:hypothetical protein
MLLIRPQGGKRVNGEEGQDDSALGLSEVEGLPVGVPDGVLYEAEGVLEETALISAVDSFLCHLRDDNDSLP